MAFVFRDSRRTRISTEPGQFHQGRKSLQQLPIGVFDSGSGGLTVLKELQAQLPRESFLYFGDTANVPYGSQPQANILQYSRQILDWMTQYPVKMAIMACNTSSALALDAVRSEFNIPILGIILPGARAAAVKGKRIGIIATPATVASNSYREAILEKNPQAEVFQVACPEFVPLIEGNLIDEPTTINVVQQRLQPLIDAQIDTLVYGCTHYPHLAPVVEALLPKSVKIVNPAVRMATATAQELSILQLHTSRRPQRPRFFVSGCPKQFASLSKQWLGRRPWVDQVIFTDELETVPAPKTSTADVTAETIVL